MSSTTPRPFSQLTVRLSTKGKRSQDRTPVQGSATPPANDNTKAPHGCVTRKATLEIDKLPPQTWLPEVQLDNPIMECEGNPRRKKVHLDNGKQRRERGRRDSATCLPPKDMMFSSEVRAPLLGLSGDCPRQRPGLCNRGLWGARAPGSRVSHRLHIQMAKA